MTIKNQEILGTEQKNSVRILKKMTLFVERNFLNILINGCSILTRFIQKIFFNNFILFFQRRENVIYYKKYDPEWYRGVYC